MADERILRVMNQCPLTGVEREIDCVFPSVSGFKDCFGNYRFIYKQDGDIVGAIQLEHEGGTVVTVVNTIVKEEARGQKIGKQLFLAVSLTLKGLRVRHSQHMTEEGQKYLI